MKKYGWIYAALLALCLSGCGWMDGAYVNVTPHQEHTVEVRNASVSASNYSELRTALENMVSSGKESGLIQIPEYDQSRVEINMDMAVRYILETYPIGAYAVEDIRYEIGSSGGIPAVALEIDYRRSYVEIRRINRVSDMDEAVDAICQTLTTSDAAVVLLVERYEDLDIAQIAENFALENPDQVMEMPQVTTGVYPDSGVARVLEVQLTYQNSRDSLRQMSEQIQPLFTSAEMYVTADAADGVKFTQLYNFLMERFDYTVETSITPAYSLLRHGVGDSRAFATVYAAMCRRCGLDCQVVTGSREGEARSWNIICDSGRYFHVDLLSGSFAEKLDGEMSGYVWDYSAYPACDTPHPTLSQDTPDPAQDTTDGDAPEASEKNS